MEEEAITYERLGGVDGSHGHSFEWNLTTLVYLRCQRLHEEWKKDTRNGIKSFIIANNVKDAGQFDDVVVRLEYVVDGEVKEKVIFAQCKHVADKTKKPKEKFHSLLSKQKPFENYFKSFVEIQLKREHIKKETFSIGINSLGSNSPSENIKNNLKPFLYGKDLDVEVLFYSNIDIDLEPHCELGCYKQENCSDFDITSTIFNTSANDRFQLKILESKIPTEIISKDYTNEKSIYCQNLRVYINQSDQLKSLIDKEIEIVTNTLVDNEYLRTLTIQEVQNIFTTPHLCTALTEKNDLLMNVRYYMEIIRKSTQIFDEFRQKFSMLNLFCSEIMNSIKSSFSCNNYITNSTPFLKLEKLKYLQVFHTLDKDSTFIFIEREKDIEKWIAARNTQSYSKLRKVYIFSHFHTNLPQDCFKLNETIIIISKCFEHKLTLKEYLKQFSGTTMKKILNTNISFQGAEVGIQSFCGEFWMEVFDENTICQILENKSIFFCTKNIPSLDFYIDRHFKMETFNSKIIRKAISNEIQRDSYVIFTENHACTPTGIQVLKVFKNIDQIRIYVEKFPLEKDDNITYHFCTYFNSKLNWFYSFGKSSDYIEFKLMTQDSLLVDTRTKITILADVAGMGKTTTLLSLARIHKRKNPLHWVFFIELNKFQEEFENTKCFANIDSTLHFIAHTLLGLRCVELKLFTKACNKTGNVGLFFDGFDEISDSEENFCSLLLHLEKTAISKIYLSSRPNYVHIIEEKLLQKSIKFEGFSSCEKECALVEYWRQILLKEDRTYEENLLKKASKKTINSLELEKEVLNDILAIPLQIKMVATVYYEDLLTFQEDGNINFSCNFSLSSLYEHFLKSYAKRFLIEKCKMAWDCLKKKQRARYIEEKLEGAEELACKIILPEIFKSSGIQWCKVISVLYDELGIITNKNPVVFLHRTIAEFLAAKHVVAELFPEIEDYDSEQKIEFVLITKTFFVVRKFIDSILSERFVKHCGQKSKSISYDKTCYNTPIHVAAAENNIEIMKYLLQRGYVDLNKRNKDGHAPLHRACYNKSSEAVQFLLLQPECIVDVCNNAGDNVLHIASNIGNKVIMDIILNRDISLLNKQNFTGQTALHLACWSDKIDSISILLAHNSCSVNIPDKNGDTVLHYASETNNVELLLLLLQNNNIQINVQNEDGKTPLHYACLEREAVAARILLSHCNCSVNVPDNDGNTVLHCAFETNNSELMKLLLQCENALLNVQNEDGKTPLHCACSKENNNAAMMLLSRTDCSANIVDNDGDTVLHIAVSTGNVKLLKLILKHDKSSLNVQNNVGKTPLQYAFYKNDFEAVLLLLSHSDCLVNIADKDGDTVLHYFSMFHSVEIMQLALKRDNIQFNIRNKEGKTPLHYAFTKANTNWAAWMLLSSPDCSVNVPDNDGNTVLHFASQSNNVDWLELILNRDNALWNVQNGDGKTTLHCACSKENNNAAMMLLSRTDCSANIVDNDGDTVLHIAVSTGNVKLLKLILKHDKSSLNVQNNVGKTPLQYAFYKDNIEAILTLLSHSDCLVNIADRDGNTVLHYATTILNTAIMHLVLQRDNIQFNVQNKNGKTPLHYAFTKAKTNQVARMLLYSPDCSVNVPDNNGNTVLHCASETNNVELLKIILQRDTSSVNIQNNDGYSPLQYALLCGMNDAALTLLSYSDCSVHIGDNKGNTALHYASRFGNVEIMKIILKRDSIQLNAKNDNDETALHYACMRNDSDMAMMLLSHPDCSFNIANYEGNTVLHYAAGRCDVEVLKLMLVSGNSDCQMQNKLGQTPLHFACLVGNTEAVQMLLSKTDCSEKKCDINGDNILHISSYKGLVDIIKLILQHDKTFINEQNKNYQTPLNYACAHRQFNAVKHLVSYSVCSVDIADIIGNTVLHYASRFNKVELLEFILQRNNALLNVQNKDGETPLHFACMAGANDAARKLLSETACSAKICNNNGDTVLHSSVSGGYTEIMELILLHDEALINEPNKNGNTPLHYACYYMKSKAVKLLLSHYDCSVDVRNSLGYTAIQIASERGYTEIKQLLQQFEFGHKQNELAN